VAFDVHDLFQRHSKELTRYLRGRVPSADVAADLTQEAFLALWAARSRTPIANGHAYLFRTATNLAINYNRRRRILTFVDDPETALATLADEAPSAERILLSRQELMIVYATLKEFPPAHRAVFILSRIDGRTFDEIGRMLDIQPGTAFSHMVRMLARMKLRLDEARR
jgi:RNA polymerase sigma-70 factor (ECF subfamily)